MGQSLIVAIWRVGRVWPLLLSLLLLLNLGIYAWLTYRLAPEIAVLERRYIEAQGLARQTTRGQGKAASPQELFARAAADLQVFRASIPDKSAFTGLIEEIFSLAGKSGLSIDRIGYSPAHEQGRDLLRYELTFAVGGDYGQIKKFIALLEQSARIIAIEEVSLSGGGRQEGEAVRLRLRLATYFQSEEA
ncbi:MAG: type 4a pilus biogenesis protein PilO [Desulfuromonadales bacterium]